MQTVLNNPGSIRMLAIRRLKHKNRGMVSLCITPMIDIIFLLLTFFVLTANFRVPEDFLSLKLPTTTSAQSIGIIEPYRIDIAPAEGGCRITLGGSSSITINEISANEDLAVFAQSLLDSLGAQKRTVSDPVEVSCDDNVKWDSLVKIYNIINAAGIEDVTFNINE